MPQVNFAEITLNLITEAFDVELEAEDKKEKIVELTEHRKSAYQVNRSRDF